MVDSSRFLMNVFWDRGDENRNLANSFTHIMIGDLSN